MKAVLIHTELFCYALMRLYCPRRFITASWALLFSGFFKRTLIKRDSTMHISTTRQEMESLFGAKVNLQCWVKVKEDWRNRQGLLGSFGYKL